MRIADLPVNANVIFGSYVPKTHKVKNPDGELEWSKVSEGNEFIACESVDTMAFDTPEPESENTSWKHWGCNIYPLSNVHQFLNSAQKDFFRPLHPGDQPPVRVRDGFLKDFREWELDCMEFQHVRGIWLDEEDKAQIYNIACLVTLPAVREVQQVDDATNEERMRIRLADWKKEGSRRFTLPNIPMNYIMTRTPSFGCKDICMYDALRDYSFSSGADDDGAVYPIIKLKGDVEVFEHDGLWYIQDPEEEEPNVTSLESLLTANE